ncbi:MAG TPA: head-tail adaptor protein [Pusillimonas sp.]|jgi:head-tail adaptor|nr:head-tail adaptor protein [Pusillimonas sp.]|tara:strand:+ start:71688 stop:72062 length:375 start_codon:yes stop_codon:yes gene_type:complete
MAKVDFPFPSAGKLNKRVQIRLRQDIPVGLSSIQEQHPYVFTRWASLVPVGTAVWAASVQTDEVVTHRCLIRYMDGITDQHEIVHSARVYRVRRCAPLQGERRFLVLELEELGDETALVGQEGD